MLDWKYFLLVLVLVLRLVWGVDRFLRERKAKLAGCEAAPQYPHKDPFGIDFLRRTLRWFKERRRWSEDRRLFDLHGKTFETHFFTSRTLWTIEPDNVRVIMSDIASFGFEPTRYPAMGPFMGRSMFTSDGEAWTKARALVTPIFHRAQISDLSMFLSYLDRFIEKIPTDGSEIDLEPLVTDLFLNTSFESLFGQPTTSLSNDTKMNTEEFLAAFHKAQRGAGRRVLLGPLRNWVPDASFREGCRTLIDLADKQIAAARKRVEQLDKLDELDADLQTRHVFLNDLVRASSDTTDIRGILLSAFTAGHESSGIQVCNALFLASRKPHVWSKIREEAQSLEGGALTLQKLRGLTYIRAVVDEAIRMYPLLAANVRGALKDAVLPRGGGRDGMAPVFVAKGTNVLICPYAMHRDPRAFGADADDFRPERWLVGKPAFREGIKPADAKKAADEEAFRPGWSYIPFGAGPRRCPAQERATAEVLCVLVRLAQKFERLESRDNRPWTERPAIVASNGNGVRVALFVGGD